eukprot:TRINITY_DN101489_c0_g1_i1.p1 TRINITY_DN101489_c0_g1~~TRINITY_DN101489_c0_g1_i1.p1  ORF type:complete len:310 (-),score=34.55 TRINITY_DN101489_c0_g1_i1:75-1004(-)
MVSASTGLGNPSSRPQRSRRGASPKPSSCHVRREGHDCDIYDFDALAKTRPWSVPFLSGSMSVRKVGQVAALVDGELAAQQRGGCGSGRELLRSSSARKTAYAKQERGSPTHLAERSATPRLRAVVREDVRSSSAREWGNHLFDVSMWSRRLPSRERLAERARGGRAASSSPRSRATEENGEEDAAGEKERASWSRSWVRQHYCVDPGPRRDCPLRSARSQAYLSDWQTGYHHKGWDLGTRDLRTARSRHLCAMAENEPPKGASSSRIASPSVRMLLATGREGESLSWPSAASYQRAYRPSDKTDPWVP